jgi:hypothetical protein
MARSLDSGGGPPDDEGMNERILRLGQLAEQHAASLAALERDVAVIRASYASREDLHKELSAQTWRLVTFVCGFGTALVAATYFIVTHTR